MSATLHDICLILVLRLSLYACANEDKLLPKHNVKVSASNVCAQCLHASNVSLNDSEQNALVCG